MRGPGLDLKTAIARRMADQSPFGVWTPVDFVDLGTRDAIDQALHRLTRAGDIRRIARGLYDKPGLNSLTAKATSPDPRAIVDALARRDKYRMIVDGITAANDLGLSDAVPARIVVHTDARLKPLELGNLRIVFRLTAPSKLYWAGRPAMRVVQALHWLKDRLAADRSRVQKRLTAIFSDQTHGPAILADLRDGLAALPDWMRIFLKDMLAVSPNGSPDGSATPNRRKAKAGDGGRG